MDIQHEMLPTVELAAADAMPGAWLLVVFGIATVLTVIALLAWLLFARLRLQKRFEPFTLERAQWHTAGVLMTPRQLLRWGRSGWNRRGRQKSGYTP